MHAFIQSEVEPLGQEADHVQLTALVNCIKIQFRVFSLDASHLEGLKLEFGPSTEPINKNVHFDLLFVPGHYEVIF